MKKYQWFLIAAVLIATFFLVYSIHFDDSFPKHGDEWHAITEGIKLTENSFSISKMKVEAGFHIFLAALFIVFGKNLVWIYQFFPALWACLSSIALFFLVYRKTDKNFWIALFAIIFFASIKSNSNIMGLWFFTPLSFAFPFIFLFIYFFTEGLEKENKKYILTSLIIMIFLLPVHALSVLFAIPFLIIYSLFYFKFLKREWKFFSSFILIPIIGLLFYKIIRDLTFSELFSKLLKSLQFKEGWGIVEIAISPLLLYSLAGLIFAAIGVAYIIRSKSKKYLVFVLWPASILISIIIYFITGVSYLVPYQRNLYYFALSLPILSAFGLYYVLKILQALKEGLNPSAKTEKSGKKQEMFYAIIICAIIFFFAFAGYWTMPDGIKPYTVLNQTDYDSLIFLSQFENKSIIMANPALSMAVYPISGHEPVGGMMFYGNEEVVKKFFLTMNCTYRDKVLEKYNVSFVLVKSQPICNWTEIYNKGNYIYEIN